jgi:hypothetical protein
MRFVSGTSVFPVVAVLLILSLLPIPVLAQGDPTIIVEPQTVSTYVGNTFSVDVWIRRVPSEGLALIEFKVVWDPGSLQLVNYVNHVAKNSPHWEIKTEEQVSASYLLKAQDPTIILFPNNQYALHDDMSWATLTFRCTGQGDTTIDFPVTVAPHQWGYWSDGSDSYPFDEYLNANVHQTEPIVPVGGFMEPVNKLAVFAPYVALFGVVTAIAVLIAKPRKRPEN